MRNKNQRIDAVSGVHCSFSVSFTYYTPNESNPPPEGVRLGLGVDLTKTTVKGLQSPALTVGVLPLGINPRKVGGGGVAVWWGGGVAVLRSRRVAVASVCDAGPWGAGG